MKQNGILAYPQKMAQAICKFAIQSYATMLKPQLKGMAQQQPDLYAAIVRDIPAQPLPMDYDRKIQAQIRVDLSDLPKSYPIQKMESYFRELPVIFSTDANSGFIGLFSFQQAKLNLGEIRSPKIHMFFQLRNSRDRHFPKTKEDYVRIKEDICATLRHELQHFVQVLFAMALGTRDVLDLHRTKRGAGIPREHYELEHKDIGRQIKAGSITGEMERVAHYAMTPFEFFTFVADMRARLAGLARKQKSKRRITREMVREVVTKGINAGDITQPFSSALKSFAKPLYRRLMSELYAFANTFNAKEAEKEQAAKRPINASRVIAAVLEDLDRERSSRAGYLRLNRQHFLDYAQAELTAQGR